MLADLELTDDDHRYLRRVRRDLRATTTREVADSASMYAERLLRRGLPVLFDLRHISHVTGVRANVVASLAAAPGPNYTVFRIAKRAGGSREIAAPRPTLKHIQRWINLEVLSKLRPHAACHGFVQGRSIVTNASPHLGADLILKLDIRDFFLSVTRGMVYRTFRRTGYTQAVARLLTSLTTLDRCLPQGAPTSPSLANLVAYALDARLTRIAEHRDLTYTRYADDLTFSGRSVARAAVKRLIERAVRDAGFTPHERKARYLHPHHRQAITGVVVNERLNWPRQRRRWLRQELYYLERFGIDEHLAKRGSQRSRYKEFVYGHAFALHAVRPDEAASILSRLDEVEWPY